MDEQFKVPMNMHTYFFNISKANEDPENANWEYLHDYIKEYGLRNMSPDEIYFKIAERLTIDEHRAV